MALAGVRVIELAGLAPGPFAGMVLADFGAEVIRVDRAKGGGAPPAPDLLARGKKSVALNLKDPADVQTLKRLVDTADALIEPFRPGVMEKLGLGPGVLCARNPRLVYARMTGFGQGGVAATRDAAGHDMNYLAQAGVLKALSSADGKPRPPVNILGDFAGGGMMCAFGVVLALYERQRSGRGQVVDAAMTDGAAYLSTFVFKMMKLGRLSMDAPGTGQLDGGHPAYDTYETKDGRWFTVGALEAKFWRNLVAAMEVSPKYAQYDADGVEANRRLLAARFKEKTLAEWVAVFEGRDCCAWPVLDYREAVRDPHNVQRGAWMALPPNAPAGALPDPAPCPKLSRTPGVTAHRPMPKAGQHNSEILSKL